MGLRKQERRVARQHVHVGVSGFPGTVHRDHGGHVVHDGFVVAEPERLIARVLHRIPLNAFRLQVVGTLAQDIFENRK